MARTTKHPRKSGATTIKKDGKIVGNVGVGKTKIPTPSKKSVELPINDQKSDDLYLSTSESQSINNSFQQFHTATLKSYEYLSYDTAKVLWELTEKQPKVERLNTLASYIDRIAPNAQRKLWIEVEKTILAENTDDTRKLLLGGNGKIDEKILDMFCRHAKDLYVNVPLRYVLKNHELSATTLDFLVKKNNPLISSYAMMHKNTTSETLTLILKQSESFTSDQKNFVYEKISAHPHSDPDLLDHIYGIAKCAIVEDNLVFHPHVAKRTLEKLAHSVYFPVQKTATIRLKNMEKERVNDDNTNN